MNVLGCRVVRGPHWKWGDQDGGEGGVGTIISTNTFVDDKPLEMQTDLVRWDTGYEADYRVGLDGNYDLRILDSSPSGVYFNDVICDGCEQYPLLGTRWKCSDCYDYDLCTNCYNNDIHDLNHNFIRNDHCDTKSIFVGQRSSAVKVQAKGIFPGSEVTNGKDSEDDLGYMAGTVIMDHRMNEDIPVGKVLVQWSDGSTDAEIIIEHRIGYDGKVDLKLERFVPNIYYYRDHLMIQSILLDANEMFQVGDKVTVHLGLDELHQITVDTFDYWDPEMERGICEVGSVERVDENGIVVKYETLKEALLFPYNVLLKVHDLRVEDRVTVSANEEKVKILQEGHRGWVDEMEEVLGKGGRVTEVDEKGDARVKVGENIWWFNPAALILESKEEEREPRPDGTVMTDCAEKDATEDDGTLNVGEFFDTVVKAIKEEDVMSKVIDGYKSFLQSMPSITVVVNEDKGHTEVTTPVNTTETATMTEEDDSQLKGQACAAPQQAGKSKMKFQEELESFDEDDTESFFVRRTIINQIPLHDRPHRTDNVYKMTSYPRGVAVIVNIERFENRKMDRVGSSKDEEDVIRLFQHLHFIVETIDKTTGDNLLAELHRISTNYDFSECGCFILCIMSHGTNDSIYTSDGKELMCSLIVSLFRKSKSLAGKPKLFFFQACRGGMEDQGVTLTDSPPVATNHSIPATLEPNDDADVVLETADVLEFYSSYEGFASYRDSETGSPFIQSIVEVFRKYACRHHILELITKVKKRVSKGNNLGKKQMPHHNDTLTKHLYFWPGVQLSDEYDDIECTVLHE